MRTFVTRFMSDECGATAIEYALIASGIGIVIITGIAAISGALNTNFNNVSTAM